jgi:putative Holliday junction resolvase
MLPGPRQGLLSMGPSLRWGDVMITAAAAQFREALPGGGRLLGLDVGTKTIGLALCDSQWTIATPAELIRRAKFTADLETLRAFAAAQQAKGLVIGLPLNLDGTDSPRTQSVRAFARNLAPLGLPILLWDERWSTQAVTRTLLDADASRARRAELVDKMASAYILQGAIDALTMGPPSHPGESRDP